jgi:UDP-N-acetylglucosamine acyltransferase
MSAYIHPSATIHPTAIIYDNVHIFANVYIGPFCVIGAPAEMRNHDGRNAGVFIHPFTRLEKAVVVDAGYEAATVIGLRCMLMSGVHIGHDANIGDDCTISPKAVIGGHTKLLPGVYVGIGADDPPKAGGWALCDHWRNGAFVNRKSHILPGTKWAGVPARQIGMNDIGT